MMNTVHIWKCLCGVRFKAVCEVNTQNAKAMSIVVCRHCQNPLELSGDLVQQFEEVGDGMWRTDQQVRGRDAWRPDSQ